MTPLFHRLILHCRETLKEQGSFTHCVGFIRPWSREVFLRQRVTPTEGLRDFSAPLGALGGTSPASLTCRPQRCVPPLDALATGRPKTILPSASAVSPPQTRPALE